MNLNDFFDRFPEWRIVADYVVIPPDASDITNEFPDADQETLSRCFEWFTADITRGTAYVRFRREGSPHGWAAMLALQSFPGIETTDTFWGGRAKFSDVYGEKYANEVKSLLARKGINLKPGDEYSPQLARFKGDPEAVIPFNGARSYIRRICEKRGWACEGAVNLSAREPDSDPHQSAVPMAEDVIRDNARRMVAKNPDLKRLNKRELREKVLEAHGPRK